jgi:quinoprotein glucose dehydrogenase
MNRYCTLLLGALVFAGCNKQDDKNQDDKNTDYSEWPAYAGSVEGNRYSSNDQINASNVAGLQVAWSWSSSDKDTANRSQNQCNPIMVDGVLYGTSPRLKLFALDAATGKEKWVFDPAALDTAAKDDPYAYYKVNRGVMYWQDNNGNDKRIFYSAGSRTFAINASDGKLISTFGNGGYIDLTRHLDREEGTYDPFLVLSTPGVIYKDIMILGSRVTESANAAPGHIRAYDVRTGEFKWIFHTIPYPGEKYYDTWPDTAAYKKLGGANSWAGMSLDNKRGIVYIPTGTVSGDFYGGVRKGANLFGNSLIALEAATGKYLWHYQVIHHDLWDRDLPANPNLVTLTRDGKTIDAVAQITKHGYVFVFDRTNGQPVFPIEERPVPQHALPGEEPWPTQPIPVLPEPFARSSFDSTDVSDLTPETHKEMMAKYRTVKDAAMFSPPSKEGVWIFPGFDGGGEWGGAAVDIESGVLYINSTELPWALHMIDVTKKSNAGSLLDLGKNVYNRNCLACHGSNLQGNGPAFPPLTDIAKKYTPEQVEKLISSGRNMMPAFKQITQADLSALIAFLYNNNGSGSRQSKEPQSSPTTANETSILDEIPYTMTGYNRFLDSKGYPGIKPPWGTLNAVDLNSGKLLWKVPLGEFEELTAKGIPPTGTETYGGPLVTKGGLVFIAATKDEKIRAFDKTSGKVLWEAKLPAAGFATPATYNANGKQYVVIACGGGKTGNKSGDTYVAFALPENN